MGKRGFYRTVKVNWRLLCAVTLGAAALFTALFTVSAATVEQGTDDLGVKIPIVMYHSILKDKAYHGKYVISPDALESDILYLKEHGYTTVLPQDLIAYTQGEEMPEKPVILTFDDGYYNNYLYAFELAKKHDCKFLISPIGYFSDLYTESGEHNGYYTHCTWDHLKEMTDSGLVEVGNHSYDLHKSSGKFVGVRKSAGETEEQYRERLTKDLEQAQNAIKDGIGAEAKTFVYPFGAVSKTTPDILKKMGFSVTMTCKETVSRITRDPESLYGLGRYLRPSGMSSREFFEKRMKLPE